ncbi:hypothetical protein AA14337_3001 [Acetobacter malorum DSM 14337]|uniref:DUF7007 domain-containing protein n=1 Tax=Acetobacter malorum DSM 14337 TaxID=1307910 RepID=A0ABQ0PZ16_9PROT|nr:hypothetical protein [Acetobacter malorum]GBQ85132.1 hypothetical protein AA14337_3001 [Acetobacter malorum DSM 14337]
MSQHENPSQPLPRIERPEHPLSFRPVHDERGRLTVLEGIGRLTGGEEQVLVVGRPQAAGDLTGVWEILDAVSPRSPKKLERAWGMDLLPHDTLKRRMGQVVADVEHSILHPEVLGRKLSLKEIRASELQNTPWGKPDHITVFRVDPESGAPDIMSVSTPGHGGFVLTARAQAGMPPSLRLGAGNVGFYEEDSDWTRVALAHPELFVPGDLAKAEEIIRHWDPQAWEQFYGQKLQPGQSSVNDRANFLSLHEHDLIAVSACLAPGDESNVLVTAVPGENRNLMGTDKEKQFIIPYDEYRAGQVDPVSGRKLGIFVINPIVHAEYDPEPSHAPVPGM